MLCIIDWLVGARDILTLRSLRTCFRGLLVAVREIK